MNNTLLERTKNIKGMIIERQEPSIIITEVKSIFDELQNIDDVETSHAVVEELLRTLQIVGIIANQASGKTVMTDDMLGHIAVLNILNDMNKKMKTTEDTEIESTDEKDCDGDCENCEIGKNIRKDIEDIIDGKDEKEKLKEDEVTVTIKNYLDVTVVEIDKKVSYSVLMRMLNKGIGFDKKIKDTKTLTLEEREVVETSKIELLMILGFNNEEKDLVVNLTSWGMNKDVADMYAEGFAQYIMK